MNAAELKAAFAARKPIVRPVVIEGVGTVYMRDQTVGEINAEIDSRTARLVKIARSQGIEVDESDPESVNKAAAQVRDPHRIARAIARRMCDEDGVRIFDPENEDDLETIGKLEESAFNKLNERVQEDAPKN